MTGEERCDIPWLSALKPLTKALYQFSAEAMPSRLMMSVMCRLSYGIVILAQ